MFKLVLWTAVLLFCFIFIVYCFNSKMLQFTQVWFTHSGCDNTDCEREDNLGGWTRFILFFSVCLFFFLFCVMVFSFLEESSRCDVTVHLLECFNGDQSCVFVFQVFPNLVGP